MRRAIVKKAEIVVVMRRIVTIVSTTFSISVLSFSLFI